MSACVVVRSVRRARSFWAVVHLQTRAKSSRSNCQTRKVPSLSRSDEIRRRTYLYQRHRTRLRASPRPLLSVLSGLLEQRRAVALVLGRPAEGHALRRPERPVEHVPRTRERRVSHDTNRRGGPPTNTRGTASRRHLSSESRHCRTLIQLFLLLGDLNARPLPTDAARAPHEMGAKETFLLPHKKYAVVA